MISDLGNGKISWNNFKTGVSLYYLILSLLVPNTWYNTYSGTKNLFQLMLCTYLLLWLGRQDRRETLGNNSHYIGPLAHISVDKEAEKSAVIPSCCFPFPLFIPFFYLLQVFFVRVKMPTKQLFPYVNALTKTCPLVCLINDLVYFFFKSKLGWGFELPTEYWG